MVRSIAEPRQENKRPSSTKHLAWATYSNSAFRSPQYGEGRTLTNNVPYAVAAAFAAFWQTLSIKRTARRRKWNYRNRGNNRISQGNNPEYVMSCQRRLPAGGGHNEPFLLLHHGVGGLFHGARGFLSVGCWRVAARCLRNSEVVSSLAEWVGNKFSVLISIEPLGCSTAAVFFAGFSMFKIALYTATVNYIFREPLRYTDREGVCGRWEGGGVADNSLPQRRELIYRPTRYQGAGKP